MACGWQVRVFNVTTSMDGVAWTDHTQFNRTSQPEELERSLLAVRLVGGSILPQWGSNFFRLAPRTRAVPGPPARVVSRTKSR